MGPAKGKSIRIGPWDVYRTLSSGSLCASQANNNVEDIWLTARWEDTVEPECNTEEEWLAWAAKKLALHQLKK